MNWHGGTRCTSQQKSKPPQKNDDEALHSDDLQDVPDWLQEFKDGLVDERVPEHRDTVLDYADLFSVSLRNDKVQEFDTRWDEVLLFMTEISQLMMFWKVCTN